LDSFPCIFSHLWECIWIPKHYFASIPFSYLNFGYKPKIRVMTYLFTYLPT
jgi:hypothetical protein